MLALGVHAAVTNKVVNGQPAAPFTDVTAQTGPDFVHANGAAGLQANNSGVLASYGDNATEGNGAVNAGVTPAPPS